MVLGWLGHVALALAMQGLADRQTRGRVAGAAKAIARFVAHVITEAEYRWIERFGV